MKGFPDPAEAPLTLLGLDGNCGPVSVWLLLRYFRSRTSSERLIRLCRYTRRHGAFTIALAVALREHGLKVGFHTERDPDPKPMERRLYPTAERKGVVLGDALKIGELVDRIRAGEVAIVYFNTDENTGHFTPLIGVSRNRLILPNTDLGFMSIPEFEARWSAPGICRQCVFAAR